MNFKMSNGLKIALIVLAVILVIAIPIVGSYNSLVNLEQTVNKAESNIDTQLQRRSDLIPNLVNTVKGYASQEKDIFTDIANARSKLAGATSVTEQADADYNTAVTNYNTKRRRFPTTIISSLFGFQEKPLYKASAGATDVPSVDFNQQ